VGCLAEYVVDGVTGRLVPPADEAALAEAIVMMLSNDESRWGMGKNAKRWMEQTRRTVILRTLQVYEQARQMHKGKFRQ
jgi:glycosyltransferase involved in cell wall biosynthesis